MSVNNKRYDAVYYQLLDTEESMLRAKKQARDKLLLKYTEEQLNNPTEEISKELQKEIELILFDMIIQRQVWFMIHEYAGEYGICMYYDNCYNQANGEDL